MKPEVSVIMPTYNNEDYIAIALKSIFNQTYDNFEVVLINDASTDSTKNIVASFKDTRLKIIDNLVNRGVSYSRNRGIMQAQGKWIALLDADDWYAPQRLEKLLFIAKEYQADLVADNLFLIKDQALEPWSTLLRENKQETSSIQLINAVKFVNSDRPTPIHVKRNWSLGYTKPLIRKEFLQQNNIKYNENVAVGEDFILYLECLRQQARFYLVPQAYYYYRTRTDSLSARKPTEYLFDSCQITQSFLNQELKIKIRPKLIEALGKNLIVFRQQLTYYLTIDHIRKKSVIGICQQVTNNPYILKYLAIKFINILQNKFLPLLKYKDISINIISQSSGQK
ncbi:family 2 glycosyl transferase [Chondrocystis sp. NIES-4102]|nr:family 2 glycosyl transferase [Chondrocystis sp. NIES-4102]